MDRRRAALRALADVVVLLAGLLVAPGVWAQSPTPPGLVGVGAHSAPSVADLDGDGLPDVLAGRLDGTFVFFKNTGTPTAPAFMQQATSAGLGDVGRNSTPSVADLDGDGLPDVLAGSEAGTFVFYKNTGTRTAPAFTQTATPAGLTGLVDLSAPSVADLDGDGLLDVLAGRFYNAGEFTFFKNTGTRTAPSFTQTAVPTGLAAAGAQSAPSVADLDGDGLVDVLAGIGQGTFVFFKNTGRATAPSFAQQPMPAGLADVGFYSTPSVADLDGDGLPDVLAGDFDGTFSFFKNTGTRTAPSFTQTAVPAGLVGVEAHSAPSVADLDGDGLVDVLAGRYDGTFTFFKNARTVGQLALPVELASFTAQASGRSARLSWTTASETNNAGFTVERQTSAAGIWTDASGLIAGHGTTTERHDYAFSVDGLTAGRHTFRLRQVDTDGTVHHSEPLAVEIGVDGGAVRMTVMGNGSRGPKLRIEGAGEAVRAEAFDVLGRSVGVVHDGAVSGTVEASLPAGLTAGAYVVRVTAAGRTTSHPVVVR